MAKAIQLENKMSTLIGTIDNLKLIR